MCNNNEIAIFEHRALLVCVNDTVTDDSSAQEVYEATHYAWPVKVKRAEKADVVLAVLCGTIVGVFVTKKWMEATAKNFPGRMPHPGRYGFVGSAAGQVVRQRYVGRRLSREHRLYGPVRYVGC